MEHSIEFFTSLHFLDVVERLIFTEQFLAIDQTVLLVGLIIDQGEVE